MIILHALYNPEEKPSLTLFGERCDSEFTNCPEKTGQNHPVHPFAADSQTLCSLLADSSYDTVKSHDPINLEFPFNGTMISGSPEWKTHTTNHTHTTDIPDSFIFYETPVITAPIDILLTIDRDITNETSKFYPGGTLNFWKKAADLGVEMVIRGRYVPTTGRYYYGGTCTKWALCPSSFDTERINLLAQAMPPMQFRFIQYSANNNVTPLSRKAAVVIFLESLIMQIITRAMQEKDIDPGEGFSPMEQLRNSQELAALYYLQGWDRHKMPMKHPLITNGWKDAFMKWVEVDPEVMAYDPPWKLCAKIGIKERKSIKEGDNLKSEPWILSFFLQSSDEPNVLIPPSQCFAEKYQDIALPGQDELEKTLNNAIDTIKQYSPDLRHEMRSHLDPTVLIPETDLIRFLTYDAPAIEKAGVSIEFPDWWGSPALTPRFDLSVRQISDNAGDSIVGLHTLLNFDYRISIGEDLIDPTDFRRMVEQKTSVVKAGRRWVTVDQDHLQNFLNTTGKKFKKNSLSIADFLRLYAKGEGSDAEMKVFADDSWTKNLITFIRDGWDRAPVQVPDAFNGVLRQYQQTGLSFLVTCRSIGFGSCLADDMGLGKTPQTIAYLLAIKQQGSLQGPSLLICPTSIIGNWERELKRFSPEISYYVHHGIGRSKNADFFTKCETHNLIITSYALVHRDINLLSQVGWNVIIYDEIQNIKNAQTKQFQAAKTLSSNHRIALTGTPVENHLTELWAIMEILNPGYLGSLHSFQKTYANPIEKGGCDDKAIELRRLIRPFLLRRVKTDTSIISDLPEKMEMQVYCPLTHEQAALYQATVNELATDLRTVFGIARRGRVLAALTRLKQICNHPSFASSTHSCEPERSGKVKRLVEMLEEVKEEGDAAIIFTQYATFAKVLAEQIKSELQKEVLLLTGSTPRMRREEMITRFMRNDGPQFFVISLRAGGTGLNLMRATHVFHIDRWWNPAVEDQATDRAYRIGQTRRVQVHLMIAAGTLEEQIDEMIHHKRTVADQVISAGEEWLTELPNGELMDVLRLREQVFGDEL